MKGKLLIKIIEISKVRSNSIPLSLCSSGENK